MRLKPYWAFPSIRETSLTECISSHSLQSLEGVLKVKREAATKACTSILKEDKEAEIIVLLGSVAHGDIVGWFSDVDMLVITNRPKKEEMILVNDQPVMVEYNSWEGFEDLVIRIIAREEYETRSSYLFLYGNPYYLYSSPESQAKYEHIVNVGIETLWKEHVQIDEYLDDFVWFYGAAVEASKYGKPLTAIGKILRGTTLLLRYYLVKNRILLRKPLPDERTLSQLRNTHVPKELLDFIEQLYHQKISIEIMLQQARKMYLEVTEGRKWLNEILL